MFLHSEFCSAFYFCVNIDEFLAEVMLPGQVNRAETGPAKEF
jgi:hypothetical protein